MKRKNSIRKYVVSFFILSLLALSIFAYTQRERAQLFLTTYITEQINQLTGCEIEFGNISFTYPLRLEIDAVQFSKDKDKIASIEGLSIIVNPWELFQNNKLTFNEIKIKKAEYLNDKKYSLSNVDGHMSIDTQANSLYTELSINQLTHLIVTLSQKNGQYKVEGSVKEEDQGWIAKTLDLPPGYNYSVNISAEGILESFYGDLQLSYKINNASNKFLNIQQGFIKSPYVYSIQRGIEMTHLEGSLGSIVFEGVLTCTSDWMCDGTQLHLSLYETSHLQHLDIFTGPIQAECHLSGSLYAPNVLAHLNTTDLTFKNYPIGNITLLSGFTYDPLENYLYLNQIQGATSFTTLLGALSIDLDQKIASGTLSGTTDLATLLQKDISEMRGTASYEIKFLTEGKPEKHQDLTLKLDIPQLYLDKSTFSNATIESRLFDPLVSPHGSIRISCGAFQSDFVNTKNILIETTIDQKQLRWPFSLSCEGEQLQLKSAGSWYADSNGVNGSIVILKGIIHEYPFILRKPVSLRYGSKMTLSSFDMAIGPGNLMASLDCDSLNDLHGHLSLQGKIESLFEILLPTASTTLTGDTYLTVDISGSAQNPHFDGTIDIQNGFFEIPTIGASLGNVKIHGQMKGSEIIFTDIFAEGEEFGTLKGTGKASLEIAQGLPFALNFDFEKIPFFPTRFARGVASGQIQFGGDIKSSKLEGKIVSDVFQVVIPNQMQESIQTVEVTYINAPKQENKKEVPKKKEWPLSFALNIEIPRQGIIKGQDWTTEWKGTINISGTNDELSLNGACHIVKGQYLFNGKAFDINEGTISFAGDPEKKTSLYVIASRDLNEIKAEVILKGPLKKPSISFRSNPPLPQREILSWILFNRGTSDISEFQGTQLNESISNLGENSSKPDILTRIKNRIGIDRIDIDSGENGTSDEVSLQVGKYISQGVYVSVSKGVTAEANRLAIEADLLKNVKMQGEVGDDAQGLLLLKWKKDY